MWGGNISRKAILHIDGDAFFASCEQSRDPALKGKPVVTGKERGIASSLSYEAKALGAKRGMSLYDIKKICPDVVILPSDYETYSLLSRRFYEIVRRYTSEVEEYGIDECFADITGLRRVFHKSYEEIARCIKKDLDNELGFTFSVGLAPNKVLSKIGSKWKKPSGVTTIKNHNIFDFLDKLPVGNVWGIGPQTTAFLHKHRIETAGNFARMNENFINNFLSKPFREIYDELNGEFVLPLILEEKTSYESIQKFKTFTPPSTREDFVFAELCKNIESACIKLRRYSLAGSEASFILRTQEFRHQSAFVKLNLASNVPTRFICELKKVWKNIYKKGILYRATGVVISRIKGEEIKQLGLFGGDQGEEKMRSIYRAVDQAQRRFGKHKVFLGSSMLAHTFDQHLGERGDKPRRQKDLFFGETKRKRIGIPMFGGEIRY